MISESFYDEVTLGAPNVCFPGQAHDRMERRMRLRFLVAVFVSFAIPGAPRADRVLDAHAHVQYMCGSSGAKYHPCVQDMQLVACCFSTCVLGSKLPLVDHTSVSDSAFAVFLGLPFSAKIPFPCT